MRTQRLFMIFIFLYFVAGCSTFKPSKGIQSHIPPGVDSTTAMLADSLAQKYFVSFESEDKAKQLSQKGLKILAEVDTTMKFIQAFKDTSQAISERNQQKFLQWYYKAAENVNRILKNDDELRKHGLNRQTIQQLNDSNLKLLLEAKLCFENAILQNPFDVETKDYLAIVLWRLVHQFDLKDQNDELINILTELTYFDQGNHSLYSRLGRALYEFKNWDHALASFKQAEQALRSMAFMNAPDSLSKAEKLIFLSSEDTLHLYTYSYYQGDIFVEKYQADSAKYHLNKALNYVRQKEQLKEIKEYIAWIDWDNGNIQASKLRDKILNEYKKTNDHEETVKQLIYLLTRLSYTKQQAVDEINWRIAFIEFSKLDKVEEGINRLHKIVSRTAVDSMGCPLDTTYNQYFNDFCTMCNNLAVHNLTNRISRVDAFSYFLFAAQFCSEIRTKLYVELAQITKYVPEDCINYSLKAVEFMQTPDNENFSVLLKLLVNSYRRQRQRENVIAWHNLWRLFLDEEWVPFYYGLANALINRPNACIRWSQYTLDNFSMNLSPDQIEQLYALIIHSYETLENAEMVRLWQNRWFQSYGGR